MNFAVIGSPIEHTLSPAIHYANFNSLNLDDTYRALHISPEDLNHMKDVIKQYDLNGFGVDRVHFDCPLVNKDQMVHDRFLIRYGHIESVQIILLDNVLHMIQIFRCNMQCPVSVV